VQAGLGVGGLEAQPLHPRLLRVQQVDICGQIDRLDFLVPGESERVQADILGGEGHMARKEHYSGHGDDGQVTQLEALF